MIRIFAIYILIAITAAGCSMLPGTGPSTFILDPPGEQENWYQLIDVDERTIASLMHRPQSSFLAFSQYKAASEPVVGVGDTLRLTVWEAAPGSLFNASLTSPAGTSVGGTTIPDQVVPRAGTISVPFAGDINVTGKTPREVEKLVQKKLSPKAVDPQVLVSVVRSVGSSVTVSGDAVGGAQIPLGPGNERVLEAISLAGGLKAAEHETLVTLVRKNQSVSLSFSSLTEQASENIKLAAGDVLFVNRRPRTYTVLGAASGNAEIPFTANTISLAQAIARSGGLSDSKADASGVFIFRYETPSQIPTLLRDPVITMPNGKVAVIYRVNMREPKGLFFAQAFPVMENDMIYISTAPAAELAKFFAIINSTAQPAGTAAVLYRAAN
jgi:polysaccharide biosynthesis/export protein